MTKIRSKKTFQFWIPNGRFPVRLKEHVSKRLFSYFLGRYMTLPNFRLLSQTWSAVEPFLHARVEGSMLGPE